MTSSRTNPHRSRAVLTGLFLGVAGLAFALTLGVAVMRRSAPRLDADAQRPYDKRCNPSFMSEGGGDSIRYSFDGLLDCVVVVARVVAVHDEGATLSTPPTVLLDVEEVLNGDLSPGPLKVVWREEAGSILGCGPHERVKEPTLSGPTVGERMIVAGDLNRSRRWFMTTDTLRAPFFTALRQAVLAAILEEKREATDKT